MGVDIFFVISGYLITSILLTEIRSGGFSITQFYERRARRILPALFFVMLCCIPFAYMWMLPAQLAAFGRSVIAVTMFSSNILFWRREDYFAPSSELEPLLHTWSLAVEEQYYLLFPIVLMILLRFGRSKAFWCIVLAAFGSLALSEWSSRHAPSANFYLAPTRTWELLAGSICAFVGKRDSPHSANFLSMLGLGLICFSIFSFDETTPFPGVYALAPVGGTTLIILFAGTGAWVARLLATSALVGIGLISYSAYLWHQPLFAFARIHSLVEPSRELMLALAACSMVLAYLSWRFVERPFRRCAGHFSTRKLVFTVGAAGSVVFIVAGGLAHVARGFPERLDQRASKILAINMGTFEAQVKRCWNRFGANANISQACHIGQSARAASFALIGDSHAGALLHQNGLCSAPG